MSRKPQSFHITENAIPYSANSPIPIPHHWKEEVKQQLDKDVKLGILRKAPLGEPTEWYMKMVTVPKKDGSPRHTADFQPINKFCKREVHYTPCLLDIVSNFPLNVIKQY